MKPQLHRPSVTQKRAVLAAAGAADGNMSRTEWSDEDREIVLKTCARLIEAESR